MKITFNKIAQIFSYKFILSAIIILFTIIPSLFAFTAIKKYVNEVVVDTYITDYMDAAETKLSENISTLIYRINTLSLSITTRHPLYIDLLDEEKQYEEIYESVGNYINKFLEKNDLIEGVSIVTSDNTVYNYSNVENFNDLYNGKITKNIGDFNLWVSDYCIKADDAYYFIAGKRLQNYYNGYDAGYLIMYINENIFSEMFKNYTFSDSTFFITCNGNIISHADKKLIGSNYLFLNNFADSEENLIKINNNCIISKRPISTNGIIQNLEVVSVNYFESFNTMIQDLNKKFLVLLLIDIVISIFLAIVISNTLLSEIETLRKNVLDFGVSPTSYNPIFKLNEIKLLENDFKNMTIRINKLIKNIREEKEKQRLAELSALQAQINPHFIYNTLDSIACIALLNKNNDEYNMICSLANFFRISLTSGRETITIREEIEHVKNYLYIESMRFPNKFEVIYDIDEKILDVEIIKIILQPIVENSIKHGFDKMDKGGKIKITGKAINQNIIEFTVTDNGCGMDFNPLTSTFNQKRYRSGYGIKNINDRLILAYGKNFGLRFESTLGEGTTVHIKIKTQIKNL